MKTKRVTALLMAGCLAASALLGGCGTENPNQGETQQDSAQSASDAGTDGELEEITVTMMIGESAAQELPDSSPILDAIKEKFNINLELQVIPSADYTTKKSTVLASNSMPDIISGLTVDEVKQYARTGMFLNLDEYQELAPDYFGLVDGEDRALETDKIRVDDSLYCFYKLEKDRISIASIIGIRMDLLEEQGIETPTTFEEYYDALLKIKEAHPDMYGFSSRSGTNYLIGAFAYSLGTGGFPLFNSSRGIYYEPDRDAYVYGPTDENFTRVVEFLRQAYADGILDPDYATMDKDTMFEKLSSGKMMSVYDNNSFIARTYNPALSQIDENAYFDILEPMANEDGVVRSYRYNRDWQDNVGVISSQTKYPERIVEMMNWLYTEEGSVVSNFGEEGVHYDLVDGVPTYKQELIDEYSGADDVASAVLGSIGAGLLGLGYYVDEGIYRQTSDPIYVEEGDRIAQWTEEGKITYLPGWPSFTDEEQEKVTEIEQKLSNVFDQEIDAFITGKKSMDEWDSLVETLKSQGSEELEEIFNTAYDRLK